jgi:methionyl-tRNA formyltransferase
MHGSLLPRYRGRSPVNWAVLHGERETGMTLHRMVEKPDAGEILGQEAVPIGENETAFEVFAKLTPAAGRVLADALPVLLGDTATWPNGSPPGARPQARAAGNYFGGRKPEDGRIDWSWPARRVHNLIRAVAPPFPAAFTHLAGERVAIHCSWWAPPPADLPASSGPGALAIHGHTLYARCGDGRWLELREAAIGSGPALQGEALTRAFAGAVRAMGQFGP